MGDVMHLWVCEGIKASRIVADPELADIASDLWNLQRLFAQSWTRGLERTGILRLSLGLASTSTMTLRLPFVAQASMDLALTVRNLPTSSSDASALRLRPESRGAMMCLHRSPTFSLMAATCTREPTWRWVPSAHGDLAETLASSLQKRPTSACLLRFATRGKRQGS